MLDLTYYERCITTLERAYQMLLQSNPESIEYNMYRSACIKEFEIILEQSGKLLRKILKPYFHSPKVVDKLYFKDIFREAVSRDILSLEVCERFLEYRDSRNITVHEYGEQFAQETLKLISNFIHDSKLLAEIFKNHAP